MRPNFKNILIIALMFFSGASIYLHFYNNKVYRQSIENHNKILDDSVRHYIVENQKIKFEKEAVVVQKSEVEAALTYAGENIKSLKKEVGSLKNIVVFYKNKIQSIDTIKTSHRDTVYIYMGIKYPAVTFDWSNDHLSIKNAIIGFDSTRSVFIPYSYNLDFKATTHIERKLFKKNKMVTKFEFSDPNIVPVTSTVIYVEQERKFYETVWFQGGIGFIMGVLISR